MSGFVKAAKVSEIGEGKMKMVDIEGEPVCLINSGGTFYAIDDMCTHEDGPMHEGWIEGGEVVCPWHQAKFDMKTGKVNKSTDWASKDIRTYETKIEGDDILVKI